MLADKSDRPSINGILSYFHLDRNWERQNAWEEEMTFENLTAITRS
jgi:hypothetical protein